MTVSEVLLQYEGRLRDLRAVSAPAGFRDALVPLILAAGLVLFLVLGVYAIRKQVFYLWPVLPIPVVAVAARNLVRRRQSRYRAWRLQRYYERGVRRLNGYWAASGSAGEEFADSGHPYAADLNLFGEGSLFELLSIARTSIGQRGLANFLLETSTLEETRLRQAAVRELQGKAELREKMAILGNFEFSESKAATFEEWLDLPAFSYARFLPVLMACTSAVLAGIVLAGFAGLGWPSALCIWFLIVLHTGIGIHFQERVNRIIEGVRSLSMETHVLRGGLELLEAQQFQASKLRHIVDRIRGASESLRKLERLLNAVHQRDKEWFYVPSRVLLVGTQLCMAMEQWRREHGEELRVWLGAWAEFEALNALGGYAYENPENSFPEFSDGEACFEARGLAHPLLARESSVVNDVELNSRVLFYIVSGSNMSGKSTLLRAIGLNAVLAYAGAPVRASALRLSGLSVFASISLVDSLLQGKSKFLVEVDRLRQAIESAVEDRSVLFLIDEIFSGTNSRDRRIAAEAVVRTLVNRGGIGALSTHDLALTEIAGALQGVNVHMGSRDEQSPLDFDYRLKLGITRESNALAIARMAGVPV